MCEETGGTALARNGWFPSFSTRISCSTCACAPSFARSSRQNHHTRSRIPSPIFPAAPLRPSCAPIDPARRRWMQRRPWADRRHTLPPEEEVVLLQRRGAKHQRFHSWCAVSIFFQSIHLIFLLSDCLVKYESTEAVESAFSLRV